MANVPISNLPSATSVSSTDLVPLVHSGVTSAASVQAMVNAAIAAALATIERRDTVLNVPADGTVQPIDFTEAIPVGSSVGPIAFGVSDYSGSDNAALSMPRVVGEITSSGFSVVVGGGQTGSTCSLLYIARIV